MTYALDTNTIIHILNDNKAVVLKRNEAVSAGSMFVIPPIVDYEIRRGLFYKPARKKEALYSAISSHYGIGEMAAIAWTRAASIYADLRRAGYTVGDADILIAAFCIVNGYTLVTNNTKDFEKIDGLLMVDWVGRGA